MVDANENMAALREQILGPSAKNTTMNQTGKIQELEEKIKQLESSNTYTYFSLEERIKKLEQIFAKKGI